MLTLLTNMPRDVLIRQLQDGLVLLVLGMGFVFIFLAVLVFVTKMLSKACAKISPAPEPKKKAPAAAVAANAATAAPRATEVDSWDEEFDMVVVGSGFAGLSACYEAQRLGLKKIVVLEKMEAYGGNSALCGGLMCMPLTKLQKANGIKDDPELLVKDMFKAGRGFNHPELARTLAQNAYKAYDMMQVCGVQLKDKVIRLGGHSAPRAHLPVNASGGGVVVPLHKYLRGKGVEFRNRVNVKELVVTAKGCEGVIAAVDYDWRTGSEGKLRAIKARYSVVVASGGWGQDKEFVSTTMSTCTSSVPGLRPTRRVLVPAASLPITPLPKALLWIPRPASAS